MTGHEILWNDTSWSEGTFDQDLGPLGLKNDNGEGCIRIDVRDICPNAPETLVLKALNEMWKCKQIVSYGPAERPGRGAVYVDSTRSTKSFETATPAKPYLM